MSWALNSKSTPITFMNLGYWPTNETDTLIKDQIKKICKGDERDMAHYYLYEKCLSYYPTYPVLRNVKVIEVGAGNGSGINWIRRSHPEIGEITGIDKVRSVHGLVRKADAASIPFPDETFDLVLNVESSHLYGNENAFLQECHRILKPTGHICLVDIRYKEQIAGLVARAQSAGLINDKAADITQGVLEGIERTTEIYDEMLRKAPLAVRIFAPLLRSTYCAAGTEPHRRLKKRLKVYYAMLFTRK